MKINKKTIIFLILLSIIFANQILKDIKNSLSTTGSNLENWYWNLSFVKSSSPSLVDNPLIYKDDDTQIYDLYLIVLPTFDEHEELITFADLNSIKDFRVEKPKLKALVLNTDNNGEKAVEEFNAIITLRGHSTMLSDKKSYKITIQNDTFLGNQILNLNKHPFDAYRVRNKIAFELFRVIPDITSLRTNFINLYIKDLTEDEDTEFVDYGIYTNIEQPNKNFLKDHKLDSEGYLYKAEYFQFFRYPDNLRNIDDPLYTKDLFEEILEIKVGKNHDKLINMLEDVNNLDLDINKVLDKHFNRENYFTWLAINILLGNYDTKTQNFFLYSSHDNYAWYFLPWDYDGSMNGEIQIFYDSNGIFQGLVGVSNYWGSVLHQRVFKDKNNLEELNKKIEEISEILTLEYMTEITYKYLPVVKLELDDKPVEELLLEAESIINSVNENKKLYYDTIEKPMPIYLGDVEKVDNGYYFFWDDSYDLQGDRISYTIQISKTPNFDEIYFEKKGMRTTYLELDIEPGEYYWRVIVVDSKGNTQRAFDLIVTEDYKRYFGIGKITIE